MDELASKIALCVTGGTRIDSADWLELRELLSGVIWSVKKSFKVSLINSIDAESVIDYAILKSLGTYKIEDGRFDYHASRWIHELVKREIIKNVDIKIPYKIAKKNYLIEEEDREDFIDPENEDRLREKYDLTKSEYNYLSHIKHVIGSRVEMTQEVLRTERSEDDFDIATRLEEIISKMTARDSYIIYHSFGICGRAQLSDTEMGEKLNLHPSTVGRLRSDALKRLRDCKGVKDKLGDFYFG